MDSPTHQRRSCLLDSLTKEAQQHLDAERAAVYNEFLGNAISVYPDEEFFSRPAADIFRMTYRLLCFMEADNPLQPRLEAFNPDREVDGWDAGYSTVFVNLKDMPFLVDSLRMTLNRRGLNISIMHSCPVTVSRHSDGKMRGTHRSFAVGSQREALIMMEFERHSEDQLEDLARELLSVLDDVGVVVNDFDPMLKSVDKLITNLSENVAASELLSESLEFLRWLRDGKFTFLGYAEYDLDQQDGESILRENSEARLGLFRKYLGGEKSSPIEKVSSGVRAMYERENMLTLSKSSKHSRVHKDVHSDYVVVKRYDRQGRPVGESRILGIYSSQVYSQSPRAIPLIRRKINWVIDFAGLEPSSHGGKALLKILEFHPRDDLFHTPKEVLAETVLSIWQIYERRAIRVFVHPDPFDKFASCIVYLPRERYNTAAREKIQTMLNEQLDATESSFTTQFLIESVLVRVHFVLQVSSKKYREVKVAELEKRVVDITHDWGEVFLDAALKSWGSEQQALARSYQRAFPEAYKERYSPESAVHDVELIDKLEHVGQIATDFRYLDDANGLLQLRLIHLENPLELSDMIPMLENLGFRVMMERPYLLRPEGQSEVWIQDFHLKFSLNVNVDIVAVRGSFDEALKHVWSGEAENDNFNRLVIGARLDWRAVAMLRLYARYLKQLGIAYSQDFIADTLARHLDITRNLVALFKSYFDPRYADEAQHSTRSERLSVKIREALDGVDNVNEDTIIRYYLELIEATLRTNFFQMVEGRNKPYISVKLATPRISIAPRPRPAYEIFVYSPSVEGVHLRGGKVARGGLRWSDRLEDYRTEVLGLVKAQQVKNAVIVPTGAKGGFVAKRADPSLGREAWLNAGISAYQLYIQALLDITDNLVGGELVPPPDLVRRDEDDPYLVVAADKGTATFSDYANQISQANNFWMGDAFASGGSNGYDHKGMGITARGAWVAVQRHFRELGINIQEQDFSVVGIGDMAGDVFGNGMLLSPHICLVGAFNHLHIFVDPNPNAEATFAERKRLFETPRTTWDDFDKSLLSPGGRIYSRSAKSLELTPELKQRLGIAEDKVTPTQLIGYLLRAEVDLIWNGGIGTYVKSRNENNAEVGDRANDALRVDGRELRCRVFGEGGNLGMTQRGRVEYCLGGGVCNTDFIDNAGGVDCSDHEVNIKILLNEQVASGEMTLEQRNQLLVEMTDQVSDLVLHNNYRQSQSISLSQYRMQRQYAEYRRFQEWLEQTKRLDSALEFLPSDDQLDERLNRGLPIWTRPELSVLISYSKVMLKESLLDAAIDCDPCVEELVYTAFPQKLVDQYRELLPNHRLRREIIATQLANDLVNRMGFTFFYRQMESTGANPGEVARAYTIVCQILDIATLWDWVEARDYQLPAEVQLELQHILVRLVRRSTRWFLRNRRQHLNCSEMIAQMQEPTREVLGHLAEMHETEWLSLWQQEVSSFAAMGVEDSVAKMLAASDTMFLTVGIVDTAQRMNKPVRLVAELYFHIGEVLSLDWFMSQIFQLHPTTRWQDLARESFVDDLEGQRRQLTRALLRGKHGGDDIQAMLAAWQQEQEPLIARWRSMIVELRHSGGGDFAMMSVALRELLDLVQSTVESRLD